MSLFCSDLGDSKLPGKDPGTSEMPPSTPVNKTRRSNKDWTGTVQARCALTYKTLVYVLLFMLRCIINSLIHGRDHCSTYVRIMFVYLCAVFICSVYRCYWCTFELPFPCSFFVHTYAQGYITLYKIIFDIIITICYT